MNRLVITRIEYRKNSYTAYLLLDEKRKLNGLQMFEPEGKTLLGNIYVGYVEKIVENIYAAFVRISDKQKCYLPLEDVQSPVYTKKLSKKPGLCEGDELLVQVTRDAVKTKDPVVSTRLTLHGHYCFLTTENTCLGVSKKIPKEQAEHLLTLAEALCPEHERKGYGLVFRTNSAGVCAEELQTDIQNVQQQFNILMITGNCGRPGDMVYRELPGYLTRLKSEHLTDVDQVITDCEDLYEEICSYLPHLTDEGKLQLYRDDAVSLSTLYHLRGSIDELLGNRVWLDSGANIIIESLETLTIIDVNSGKNQSKKPDALFNINVEAAKEIARQLRLRNISGMIIIDFINLKSKEQKNALIHVLREELKNDPVPAKFIDITKLGLVELTRKKVYKSLREIL